MLQIVVQILLIYFTTLPIGFYTNKVLQLNIKSPYLHCLSGIATIGAISQVVHFFVPINTYLLLLFLLLSIVFILLNKKEFRNYFYQILEIIVQQKIIIVVILLLIFFSSLSSITVDEGIYHAAFIKWINMYPSIKGLANVEQKYGFNSTWHLLSAVYNCYGFLPVSNSINCWLFINFLFYFISIKKFNLIISVALFFPTLLIYHLIDPSADMIILFFTIAFISDIWFDNINTLKFWVVQFAFLITIKLSIVTLAPIFIYLFIQIAKNKIHFNKLINGRSLIYCSTIIFIWVLSNIILSGYIIFPYLTLSIIHTPWKVPSEMAYLCKKGIEYSILKYYSHSTVAVLEKLNIVQQQILLLKNIRWVEFLEIIFFNLIGIVSIIKAAIKKENIFFIFCLFITFLIQLVLVADFRFFAGTGFALLFIVFYQFNFHLKLPKLNSIYLVCSICCIVLGLYLYKYISNKVISYPTTLNTYNHFITKAKYRYDSMQPITINNYNYFEPKNSMYCWDSIPCYLPSNLKAHLLNNNIKNGFYLLNDSSYLKYNLEEAHY